MKTAGSSGAIALVLAAMAMSGGPAVAAGQATPTEVNAPGPDGPLAGTMLRPSEDAPMVLMIPGSGPTDRDGNNPMGLHPNSMKLLAEALAGDGIGSVRIDKRGMFGSKAAIPDPNKVTIGGYVDDVASWVSVIREKTGAPCVWLLGHSEGGLVSLASANKVAHLCGLLLVSSPGRPLGTLIREQIAAAPALVPDLKQANAVIDQLEAGKTVPAADVPPALLGLFHPLIQPYLIDALAYDPAKLAKAYPGPMLIVGGTRDLQVTMADADALAAARPDATRVTIDKMTHVMKEVDSDDRIANLKTYADPDLPLAPGLADAIAAFVKAHPHD